MNAPTDRKYSETHEWFQLDGGIVTVGITQHAADALTDITYVELPDVGKKVSAGDAVGEVESVKATSEIFTAVGGKIVEVNTALAEHPERINDDAFEEGWLFKLQIETAESLEALMDAKEYKTFVRNAG